MNKLNILNENTPWYIDGLSFKCTGCGECCTGAPGYAWVTEEEMARIADYLNMPLDKFTIRYIRRVGNRFALVELKKNNFDCIFLENKKCKIYPVRPKQCKTYPWWPENLTSKEAWENESTRCEGMRCQGEIVSFTEISSTLEEHLSK